jgi:hypothetical protein
MAMGVFWAFSFTCCAVTTISSNPVDEESAAAAAYCVTARSTHAQSQNRMAMRDTVVATVFFECFEWLAEWQGARNLVWTGHSLEPLSERPFC